MRSAVLCSMVALMSAAALSAGSASYAGRDVASVSTTAVAAAAPAVPALTVTPVATGLGKMWDVQELPGGPLLFTERVPARLWVLVGGRVRPVAFPSETVWRADATGLMGLAVDPDFASNRRIYTCQGGFPAGGGHDVRVVSYRLNAALTAVGPNPRVLLSGFPTSNGRHGGCRLVVTSDGSLLVGTGDAAQGTNPRDLDSLGGKTLRLNRFNGRPWPTNPYWRGFTGPRRYVHTYGHRNVQGVAERADGTLWSIEHGTARDDEVNLLVDGGDYGWNPVPGYNESAPMTDQSLPGDQVEARWSSGSPSVAPSGGTFVAGAQWGDLDGALAVACLKAEQVKFLTFDAQGELVGSTVPDELRLYGRLRTVSKAANGDLLITTDNAGRTNQILRVSPQP